MVKHIDSSLTYGGLITHHYVVIDMYADWCGPCKRIAPDFEKLATEFPNVHFAKLNVDHMEEMGIPLEQPNGVPCFILLNRGKEVGRVVGANIEKLRVAISTMVHH
jgi:thioredoxin 1